MASTTFKEFEALDDSRYTAHMNLPAGEAVGARYGRLLALADLCHRLLTVRYASRGGKPQLPLREDSS